MRTLILTCAVFCFTGCTDKAVLFDEVTRTSLNAAGGRAISADGDLMLDVPQGTLQAETAITIRTRRDGIHGSLVKPVYDLTADPPVATFEPKITIVFENVPSDRTYVLVNTDGPEPVEVPGSTHDTATGVLRGELAHFSGYSVAPSDPAWVCPDQADAIGASCNEDGVQCEYGQECCCGQCYPSMRCTCSGGTLGCIATDACYISACPDAGTTDGGNGCPASVDDALGGSCSTAGLACEYGQECCCGECYPSTRCTCDGNVFACHATDACFRPGCPDAG